MKILITEEASKLLRMDKRTLQKLAQKGYFPKHVCGRVGRKYLFKEEALIEFIFSKKEVA